MAKLKSVWRTQIILEGQVPEEEIRRILGPILDTEKFFNVRCEYNKKTDETIIWLLPCKSYIINPPPFERCSVTTSYERVLLVNGSLPRGFDLISDVWMPFRKACKRQDKWAKYIVIGPHDVAEEDGNGRCTEVKLIMDGRCPEEHVAETFKVAIQYIAEKLRELAENSRPADFFASAYMNNISMLVAKCLEEHEAEI